MVFGIQQAVSKRPTQSRGGKWREREWILEILIQERKMDIYIYICRETERERERERENERGYWKI
jgi:hypothetical protein